MRIQLGVSTVTGGGSPAPDANSSYLPPTCSASIEVTTPEEFNLVIYLGLNIASNPMQVLKQQYLQNSILSLGFIGLVMYTLGAVEYPTPPVVRPTKGMPLAITAVAAAPTPPPPWNVTSGANV